MPASVLFASIVPCLAAELAHRLAEDHGLRRRDDLVTAASGVLRLAAFDADRSAPGLLRGTGRPALRLLLPQRSAADWAALLPQGATGPQATDIALQRATADLARLVHRVANAAGMSAPTKAALAAWLLVAVLIAHCGPDDADLGLEDLADRL
jgi:hypothetical protein